MGFDFTLTATAALIDSDQLTLLYVKLLFGNHFPLVKAAAAQSFALVLFRSFGALEWNNIAHNNRTENNELTPKRINS